MGSDLPSGLRNRGSELLRACDDAAYAMAFSWHREFAGRLEQMVGGAIATLGLPYARELVDRLRRHIDDVLAPGVAQLGRWARRTSSRCRRKWMRRCARCAG